MPAIGFNALSKLKYYIKFIIYGNFIIALGAYCLAEITLINNDQGRIIDSSSILLFFSTLTAYNLQRIIKIKTAFPENPGERHNWIKENRIFLMILSLISSIAALFYIDFNQIESLAIIILISFISIAYVYVNNGKGLREIPFFKIFLVGAIWGIGTVLIPLMYHTVNINQLHYLQILRIITLIIAITIPFEIRDLKYDKPEIRTIPQVVGIKGSKIAGIVLMLSFLAISVVLNTNNTADIIMTFTCILLISFSGMRKKENYYLLLVDGSLVFWYSLYLIF